ncbi:hypothetical protein FE236_03225 [Mariprofundus erugo]|uniref:hypothetical protein n=1 Tax=Mariprofundus erugo TaxID=2528639 RepID=UPI0010FEFBFD|nr:hypothetical protein [Mariprofundus erugo]TLS77626.1 hypothetical protein FE236_03225 [Mariprofundus erugo]
MIWGDGGSIALAKEYLPKYLSPKEKDDLYEELRRFPHNITPFYLSSEHFKQELLQGDGWNGFVAINFNTLEKKAVRGIILSNSCDIDVANKRHRSPSVLFCPLIPVGKYKEYLLGQRHPEQSVNDVLAQIRLQEKTDVLYLPGQEGVIEEHLVFLDQVNSHPLSDFMNVKGTKIFTLSQYAFYIFIIKLSIHFSRLQEGVARY